MRNSPLQELERYLPKGSFEMVILLFRGRKLELVISKKRLTKLGDFRPGINGSPSRITINNNLNPYAFLITLIHELAHLIVRENAKGRIRPHGPEWKQAFAEIMQPFLNNGIFPEEVLNPLKDYLKNPTATSSSHTGLSSALSAFDPSSHLVQLTSLPDGSAFSLQSGKRFRKISRIRKNFRCVSLENRRYYSVSASAMVLPLKPGHE
jgi:hypothetical protein